MIRHIVLFKLREFSTPDEKKKAAETVSAELFKLKDKIPFIHEFDTGINITNDDSAYDWALNSSFVSIGDLKAYQAHPDHQAFIQFNKDYSVKKVVIDYEY